MPVVSDASAIIALNRIDQLRLLERLFGAVLIPPAVAREISPSVRKPYWIQVQPLRRPASAAALQASLGAGETEAISLAVEVNAQTLILDDKPARRLASLRGLPVVGTVGILVRSKQKGYIDAVRPHLNALRAASFHISPSLYTTVLSDADENTP